MRTFRKLSILCITFILTLSSYCFAFSHRDWNGDPNNTYLIINNNQPDFSPAEITTNEFLNIFGYDSLGREQGMFMNASPQTVPKLEREPSLSSVTPSGWKSYNEKGKLVSNNNKYPGVVSGNYIYNRCHLCGYQYSSLGSETPANLITGTRWFNVISMLPFENDIRAYIKKTNNHVLVRVIPVWEGNNLVAEGIQFEALSVEDNGKGISFNVFCPNVQPGIVIDYATGKNWLQADAPVEQSYNDPFYSNNNSLQAIDSSNIIDTPQDPNTNVINNPSIDSSNIISDNSSNVGKGILVLFLFWFFFLRGGSSGGGQSTYSNRRR